MIGWCRNLYEIVWWMTDQQRDNIMLVVYLLVVALGTVGIGIALHRSSIILGAIGLVVTSVGAVLFVARWTLQSRERKQPGWGSLAFGTAEGIVASPPPDLPADSGAAAPCPATGQPTE